MTVHEGFLSTPEAIEAFGERSFVDAMLRYEAALARAQAHVGLIDAATAETIANTCKVDLFNVPKIVRESGQAGSLAIPLVKVLKETVGLFNRDAVAKTHFGSTSQDVIDTAMALVTRPVVHLVMQDSLTVLDALLLHAEAHARTPMLARTLGQPASVTSFGWKSTQWAHAIARCLKRLQIATPLGLAVQLGGAVGTQAELRGKGAAVVERMAADLGLSAPPTPWHAHRDAWVSLGCEVGVLVGTLGKIARDISLMAQYEVSEVSEPVADGRGESSAMPHKRNPVSCMVALAAAQRAPQAVAALLAAMPQEHERALGNWQAELAEWSQLMLSAHGASRAMAQALPGLKVHAARMRANLDALRAELPPDAADTWFSPALADNAAALARGQLPSLHQARAALRA